MTQETARRFDALAGVRMSAMTALLRRPAVQVFMAAAAAFLIALSRGRAEAFVWDASVYWAGPMALISGGDYFDAGMLDYRPAVTLLPYLPAALLSDLAGTGGRAFVLVENSILIALIGAVIIPAILRHLIPVTRLHLWASAILSAGLLAIFAPFPMMDLWAVGLALGGVALILNNRWWWTLTAGVSLGIAVNMRPAYLLPVALGYVVWACFRWRHAHWPLIGAAFATLPQMAVNAVHRGTWLFTPVKAQEITETQMQFAAYIVRYDTVAFVDTPSPQQFYCNPDAAVASVQQVVPTSVGELALHFLNTFPTSLVLLAQKAGASLQWDSHTPYGAAPASAQGFGFATFLVVLVSSVGLLALVKLWVDRKSDSRTIAVVLAVWFGSLLTVLGSTPESRFALPLVLIGVLGCLVALPTSLQWRPRRAAAVGWGAGAVLLVGALLAFGVAGLANPAPAGAVDAFICATL